MGVIQIILLILLCIFALLFIIWEISKKGYRQVAIDLIVYAEKELKDNQSKFDMVVNGVLMALPKPFSLIPLSLIEKFVQKIFDEIKIALDYQKTDD